jgi:tRNA(Ile)-lysidine synthase
VTAHRPPVAERAARVLRGAGIEPPAPVLAMVSGGADSTLLAAVLAELGYAVRGLHVAHGLRGADSAADADFCRALPLPVEVRDGRVGPGGNLEARLREVRREAALAAAAGDPVATGHTATDRAETVLYRLATSGGTRALPALPGLAWPFVRPLIDVTRAEVRAELRDRGLEWREDPSNADPAFARNRIRHEVLPVLLALNARADANIARAAEVAAAERELLALLAAPFLVAGGADVRFRAEHVALQREVVRRAAAAAGVSVQHADVEALIGPSGADRRTLPGGAEAIVAGGLLRFVPTAAP